MRSLIRSLVLSVTLPRAAYAQGHRAVATAVTRAISPTAYMAHLRYLSDDALEGGAPGTRGGILAAKYIAAQFERLGLAPAGDSGTYFQRVPIIALTPEPTLAV